MTRCLLMSCSKTKISSPEEIPAIDRYNGPPFKVVRRFFKDGMSNKNDLDVFILSAAYGLLSSSDLIGDYDQKMNGESAGKLRPKVMPKLKEILDRDYSEIFVLLSREYSAAINGWESLIPPYTHLVRSQSSEGKRLRELKGWLYQREVAKVEKSTKVTGRAVIKGVIIEASPLEIERTALDAMKTSLGDPFNFRDWYCIVEGETKVSSKWLVSVLSGVDVSQFQASDARRVLAQLGFPVYRK